MQSTKIIKLAKKIAKRDKPIFDELINFEKTGKMHSKERVNFTIDKALIARFRKYCKEKGFIMSEKVESMIRNLLEH